MYLFGHIGITLGAAALAAQAVNRKSAPGKKAFFGPLARSLDVRLLVIGSMLPDIIDKPTGVVFFRDTFSNGRIFAHTLLFLILLAGVGFWLYRRNGAGWLTALAWGTFAHLVLDEMWRLPKTLYWPLLGLEFDRLNLEGIYSWWLERLISSPFIYVTETIGLAVVIWFGAWVIGRKKTSEFMLKGTID